MRVVIDIETDKLYDPTQIWVVVCKDIDTGEYHIFRNLTTDEEAKKRFIEFSHDVTLWIGHHILGFDFPQLHNLLGWSLPGVDRTLDTLVTSKLVDYSREGGHSLDQYGRELGLEKIWFRDFSQWSQDMEDYCVRDVDLTHRVYLRFLDTISDPAWAPSILLEQQFQCILNSVHARGFAFNSSAARTLLDQVTGELHALDAEMAEVFLPRAKPLREVHPKLTKYGTLNRCDFRFVKSGDLSEYNGGPFTRIIYQPFNAASHKQVVDVLHSAGWSPTEKTDTHISTLRAIAKAKKSKSPEKELDIARLSAKMGTLEKYGYRVNELNLSTLPSSAPPPARLLSQRIIRESRRRTLTEWLSLLSPDGRIHGEFQGIGAWTHRMAHQKPNLANIPNEYETATGAVKYLGKELRSLWTCTPGRVLWGVDAEGIQLRIFAHYINDKEFIEALVNGRKADKTDPHSLNQRIIGPTCKTRQAAKRFIYSLLLGAGIGKLAEVLDTSEDGARKALDRILERYQGFDYLKRKVIPSDAKQGYFIGLDGRRVPIPGATADERKHLCMSGYLQCGEAIVIKLAATHFYKELGARDSFLVDIIHDEYQGEAPNKEVALEVCEIVSNSIKWAGEELKLNCPMAGSYWNEDHNCPTIGTNWYQTH